MDRRRAAAEAGDHEQEGREGMHRRVDRSLGLPTASSLRAACLVVAWLVLSTATSAVASAESTQPRAGARSAQVILPAVACQSLALLDLGSLATRITSVTQVTRNQRQFCEVHGYISPQTVFEVLLPVETWRGNYMQSGCAAFCGSVNVNLHDPAGTSLSGDGR